MYGITNANYYFFPCFFFLCSQVFLYALLQRKCTWVLKSGLQKLPCTTNTQVRSSAISPDGCTRFFFHRPVSIHAVLNANACVNTTEDSRVRLLNGILLSRCSLDDECATSRRKLLLSLNKLSAHTQTHTQQSCNFTALRVHFTNLATWTPKQLGGCGAGWHTVSELQGVTQDDSMSSACFTILHSEVNKHRKDEMQAWTFCWGNVFSN